MRWLNIALVAVVGCSGGSSNTNDAGSDGAPPADAGLESAPPGDAGVDADGGAPTAQTLTLGPLTFGTGVEKTQCATMRLGNVGVMHAGAIHTVVTGAWHELVIYRSTDTAESGPADCNPLVGIGADGADALTVTRRADETLQLPSGDGFTLQDHQMIRLELHAVDSGSGVGATVTFDPMTDAFQRETGMIFVGLIDISIPPGATNAQLHQVAAAPPIAIGADLLVMSGHAHELSTDLLVRTVVDGGAPTDLYESTSFDNPPVTTLAPALAVTAGTAFDITCTWNNTTQTKAGFGMAEHDEQCFFRGHYAPSTGSRVCINSDQYHADACCPGNALCAQFLGN